MTRLKVSQEQALQASRAQEVLSEAARMERSVQRLEEKIDALRIELDLMREPNVL